MAAPDLRTLLDVATETAYAAGRCTLAYFGTGRAAVELKADETPVTRADREAEAVVRQIVGRRFADHAILGEEEGESNAGAPVRWIVDPLDGTKTFVRGVPLYGTLLAVEVDGAAVVGVVYVPALDEMVAAARGLGCTWNGRPCRVSQTSRLADATVLTSDERMARRRSGAWDRLVEATSVQRSWGDCYGYVLVATGRADVMIDPVMNVWDCGPMLPILEEAGGRFTDWRGRATIDGGDAVGTNGRLHDDVLAVLRDTLPG